MKAICKERLCAVKNHHYDQVCEDIDRMAKNAALWSLVVIFAVPNGYIIYKILTSFL